MACYHRPWTTHTRSDDVRHDNAIISLGHHTQSGIKCHHFLLDSTDCRMTSTWHDIFSLGLHTRTDDVGRGMRSLPLFFIYSRMKSTMECHHGALTTHMSYYVTRGMVSSSLDIIYGITTSGAACHHRPWNEHTVG